NGSVQCIDTASHDLADFAAAFETAIPPHRMPDGAAMYSLCAEGPSLLICSVVLKGMNFTMKRLQHGVLLVLFLPALALSALGQSAPQDAPEKGGHEVQVWAGGGHSVSGGTHDTGVFNVGLRYGWVLTGSHGPALLKGNFEYAVDAVP